MAIQRHGINHHRAAPNQEWWWAVLQDYAHAQDRSRSNNPPRAIDASQAPTTQENVSFAREQVTSNADDDGSVKEEDAGPSRDRPSDSPDDDDYIEQPRRPAVEVFALPHTPKKNKNKGKSKAIAEGSEVLSTDSNVSVTIPQSPPSGLIKSMAESDPFVTTESEAPSQAHSVVYSTVERPAPTGADLVNTPESFASSSTAPLPVVTTSSSLFDKSASGEPLQDTKPELATEIKDNASASQESTVTSTDAVPPGRHEDTDYLSDDPATTMSLREEPADLSESTDHDPTTSLETQGAYHSYNQYRQRQSRLSPATGSDLYTIPEAHSKSPTEADDNRSEADYEQEDKRVATQAESVDSDKPTAPREDIAPSMTQQTSKSKKAKKNKNKNKKKKSKHRLSQTSTSSVSSDIAHTGSSSLTNAATDTAPSRNKEAGRTASSDLSTTSSQGQSLQVSNTRASSSAQSHSGALSRPQNPFSESGGQVEGDSREWSVVSRNKKRLTTSASRTSSQQPQQAENHHPAGHNTQIQGRRVSSSRVTKKEEALQYSSTPSASQPPVVTETEFPALPSQSKSQDKNASNQAADQQPAKDTSKPEGPVAANANSEKASIHSTAETSQRSSCEIVDPDDDQTGLESDQVNSAPAISAQINTRDQISRDHTSERARRREVESQRQPAPHDDGSGPSSGGSTTPSSSAGQGSQRQHPAGWFWQLDNHGFPCALAGCDKRCSSWDGTSVICPRCGPYSEVRYCGQDHLFADVKAHWLYCGQMTFVHPCRESSVPREHKEGPPLLPSRHNWDTPERHRQAVHHAVDRSGDYFVFADWYDWTAAGQQDNIVDVRCSNRVVWVVSFNDREEKDRFRRVLGACLFSKCLHDSIPRIISLTSVAFYSVRGSGPTRRIPLPHGAGQPRGPGGMVRGARSGTSIPDEV
jgi:hypothetical protein